MIKKTENKLQFLIESFLKQYYLIESIYGDFITENKRKLIFKTLGKVYCIENVQILKRYFLESEKQIYRDITNVPSYDRACRVIEFAGRSGQNVEMTETDLMILAQKREAMLIREGIINQQKNMTREMITSSLLGSALNGNIDAMAVLSFLEYHGICVAKDEQRAIKRIRLCARWNHLFGILTGIAYDKENTEYYYNVLYTVLRNAGRYEIYNAICEKTGHSGPIRKDPISRILEKAFGLEIIKRGMYDQAFAKIAFSRIVSAEDKERILLSKVKDSIGLYLDYPFDAKKESALSFDMACLQKASVKREGEIDAVLKNMTVAVKCPNSVYKPLYIISADPFMSDMYINLLKEGIGKGHYVEIDASTLVQGDFSPDRDNLFIRSVAETKTTQTVFIFRNCEDAERAALSELIMMADHNYRSTFKLFHPAVSIDLSDLKFIFQSDKPIKEIAYISDTVHSKRISESEKKVVVRSMFAQRAAQYGCKKLAIDEECIDSVCKYKQSMLEDIIDGLIREAVYSGTEKITVADLKAFGGGNTAPKEDGEFGYMGGSSHA
ncbi:MAG: hypothetical protein IJS94_01695 [Clostridia bacterium]|nr:hypothetical protein [Clostridia bacterium]